MMSSQTYFLLKIFITYVDFMGGIFKPFGNIQQVLLKQKTARSIVRQRCFGFSSHYSSGTLTWIFICVLKHMCLFTSCLWAWAFNCSGGFTNDRLRNLVSVLRILSKQESARCGKASPQRLSGKTVTNLTTDPCPYCLTRLHYPY